VDSIITISGQNPEIRIIIVLLLVKVELFSSVAGATVGAGPVPARLPDRANLRDNAGE